MQEGRANVKTEPSGRGLNQCRVLRMHILVARNKATLFLALSQRSMVLRERFHCSNIVPPTCLTKSYDDYARIKYHQQKECIVNEKKTIV